MLHAQGIPPISIHRAESERYGAYPFEREEQWDSLNNRHPVARSFERPGACELTRRVFGWHPYWAGTAYNEYDYTLLSDICYFSYEVDPLTGDYTTIRNWKTTELVPQAKSRGVRVHLCVTLFSNHAAFLGSTTNRKRLIDSLIALIRLRDGDGVNIDFEAVPASQRAPLASFMAELGDRFHAEIPGSIISIDLPAVDWGGAFDVAAMLPHVDLFMIMGYDYHWRGGDQAGPVAPKNNGELWSPIDVTRSINYYLAAGIPPEKLLLGVPYYGYDWPTADSAVPSPTTGSGTAVLYAAAKERAGTYGRRWEPQSSTPYYIYERDGAWHQAWYDDEQSLGMKYDLVLMKRLAGIAIWALSYDAGRDELWELLVRKFTTCSAANCSGTIADMGGPAGNYYSNDRYTYTIAPAGATSVRLQFYSFSIANDRLELFDGRDTTAPLLGSYTAQQSPGTVTAGGALTLRFTSDSSQTSWGWIADWSCGTQPVGVPANDEKGADIDLSLIPNPSDDVLSIAYRLDAPERVRVVLVDMLGDEVATLFDGSRDAGVLRHEVRLREMGVPAGAYIVSLTAGARHAQKMVVLH